MQRLVGVISRVSESSAVGDGQNDIGNDDLSKFKCFKIQNRFTDQGRSKSIERSSMVDSSAGAPFSALMLLVGRQTFYTACKNVFTISPQRLSFGGSGPAWIPTLERMPVKQKLKWQQVPFCSTKYSWYSTEVDSNWKFHQTV